MAVIDKSDEAWQRDKEEGLAAIEKHSSSTRREKLPPIDQMLNVRDLEEAAEKVMDPAGWAYYCSGGDDEVSLRENVAAFGRLWLRPRVLVDVSRVDVSARLLGAASSFPLYVSATAMGKLADPAGEVAINRACAQQGVVYMVPTLGSCSVGEILASSPPGHTNWFQLYVNRDREVTERVVKTAAANGAKAIFVTVDAPQLGRRERDMRFKAKKKPDQLKFDDSVETGRGIAKQLTSFIDPALQWSDLPWLASLSGLPLAVKGVQCGEDAVLAARAGCRAIVLSNHGGRQLDYARSAVELLPEVVAALRHAGLRQQVELYVDGGIRRGTDIFKALALGADAVGIGRPALYGLAAYGADGVSKVLSLLRDEFATCMMLCGCASLEMIKPEMILSAKL